MDIIKESDPPLSDHYFEIQLNVDVIKGLQGLQGLPRLALTIYIEILDFYKSRFKTNVDFY